MAYKCLECGNVFERGEEAIWEETHGLESPPYEERKGCPCCFGDYEPTIQCSICGGEFIEDETYGEKGIRVCDNCIEDFCYDFDTCYAVCGDEKTEIELNSLICSVLSVSEIESILYRHLKSLDKNIDCQAFIDEEKDWFAKRLAEVITK